MNWDWLIWVLIIGFFAMHLVGGGCGHSHAHATKAPDADDGKQRTSNDAKSEHRHAGCH